MGKWFILNSMKFLTFILVLLINIQPLQAGFCDMESGQEAPQTMEHSDDGNHDCCDSDESDDSDSQSGCDGMMHCGSCNASFSALPDILKFNARWVTNYSHGLSSGVELPSHSAPPFRPPIA